MRHEGIDFRRALSGCLLGCAAGDSLGLPFEGLSPSRIKRIFSGVDGHHFLPGCGMLSDDTEHACMTAQAIVNSGDSADRFVRELGLRLKLWLAGLPAGVGLATARSIIKLMLGFSPLKSGVFSAGNGPAMRSPVIGVCFGDDPVKLREYVSLSTRITHTDPKAEYGALAAALAAYLSAGGDRITPEDYLHCLKDFLKKDEAAEFVGLVAKTTDAVSAGMSPGDFAAMMNWRKGVSGYIYQTIPAVIFAWLSYQGDFRKTITELISLGGDTDTCAAIAGAIAGARAGKDGIPSEWLHGIRDWPLGIRRIEEIALNLAAYFNSGEHSRERLLLPFLLWPRNLFFLLIVLLHGFRRLFPPY